MIMIMMMMMMMLMIEATLISSSVLEKTALLCFFFGSQDNVRNQLIQFELLLTTATFVVAIFGVVAGIFGMNFTVPIFDEPGAFKWVLIITGVCGFVVFFLFVWFFKYRRLMPL